MCKRAPEILLLEPSMCGLFRNLGLGGAGGEGGKKNDPGVQNLNKWGVWVQPFPGDQMIPKRVYGPPFIGIMSTGYTTPIVGFMSAPFRL